MPAWLDNAIFYEIYAHSFLDTNSDGIGDFQGIIRKLDYIRELGCNALWLNPCYESPFFDAGYDVSDYRKAAPRYGTNDDLRQLFDEAHKRGMHVLLDLVPGHTSIRHPWFLESMKKEKNPYTDRYIWTDSVWNHFEGIQNITGSIGGFCDRDASCAVNYYSTQPALNYGFASPSQPWQSGPEDPGPMATREAMKDIMRFWLSMGCDGFRVDMAGSLVKNDEDGRETVRLWQDFRAFLDKEFPEAAMISEWGQPDKSLAGGFHMDFLLHFGPSHYMDLFRGEHPYFSREGKGNAGEFVRRYVENYEKTNGKGLICIPSSNHDMPRLQAKLDEEERKLAFAFLLSVPGAPFLYYGDEIGMRYLEGIPSVEGGLERTGSRTPMQWDSSLNAGFSCACPEQLYIGLDPDPDRPTVENQMARPDSLYQEIRKLTALRQSHEALQSKAPITFLYVQENAYPLVYQRQGKEETIVVALNPSGEAVSCPVNAPDGKQILYSCNGEATLKDGRLEMPPASVSFILV